MNDNDSTTEDTKMETKDTNWKALIAVALVSIIAAVAVTLAVADGDDDDDDDGPDTVQTASSSDDSASADPAEDDVAAPETDDGTSQPPVDPDGHPISDTDANRVSKAALQIAGGGTVTDLDRSDDPGEAWEVEVTMSDGAELDVALDEKLNRVENTPYDD